MPHSISAKAYLYSLIFLVLGPISFVLGRAFLGSAVSDQETWSFIMNSMFWDLTVNTFALAALTMIGTSVVGFIQAFLVCFSNLPNKKSLHLFFILPLIFPLYVLGFIFVGSFEYSGPLPTFLRENLNLDIVSLFNIKSIWGVALVFTIALSPYVYLYLKSAFEALDERLFLSARSMGKSTKDIVKNIVFPQAFPWMMSGAILVCLEVFCDFGGVSVFNYETFSTAVYHAWISLFSINTAVKLSLFPTIVALVLYLINQYKFKLRETKPRNQRGVVLLNLKPIPRIVVIALVTLYLIVSLVFPTIQLLIWSFEAFSIELDSIYFLLIGETFAIGAGVALFVNIIGLIFLYFYRNQYKEFDQSMTAFTKVGYALPGSIIAIALMAITSVFGMSYAGLAALAVLAFAYTIKFFSVSFELMRRGLTSISKKMDWSSQSLGASPIDTFRKVHIPLLWPVLLSSFVMVLIEVFKEMPMTLILRPFGVDTLATRIYELTSEGEWERASLSAVFLLLLGAISLFVSERFLRKS